MSVRKLSKRRRKKKGATMEYVSEDVERALHFRGHEVKIDKVKTGIETYSRSGICSSCGSKVHIEVAIQGGSLRVYGAALTTTCREAIERPIEALSARWPDFNMPKEGESA